MKRFFFVALLVLTASALAVMPAFAEATCDHDMSTMDATVAGLIDHVQHASAMGHIDATLVTPLMAQLNIAANANLPMVSRVGALQAFIGLVNAQAGKGIFSDCATHLVMQAQAVINVFNPPV